MIVRNTAHRDRHAYRPIRRHASHLLSASSTFIATLRNSHLPQRSPRRRAARNFLNVRRDAAQPPTSSTFAAMVMAALTVATVPARDEPTLSR
jgi:hypothetical protein